MEGTNGIFVEVLANLGYVETESTLLGNRDNTCFNIKVPRKFPTLVNDSSPQEHTQGQLGH